MLIQAHRRAWCLTQVSLPCSWDADAIVENVTDEDGEVYEGAPENNVWRVQAHQASAINCLRWNPVNSQTVSISAPLQISVRKMFSYRFLFSYTLPRMIVPCAGLT